MPDDKHKVMIVDDSAIIRKIIQKGILSSRFEVIGVAGNGSAAIQLFKNTLPDIVTLDITMPEMDGFDVLSEILKIKSDAKIVIISALSDKETGIKAIKLGAKSFIAKPFSTDQVARVLNRMADYN